MIVGVSVSTSVSTQGPLARLIQPLVDSSVFDFWAGHINPAWSWSRALARVVERRVEAHDAVTLVLKPNRHVGSFVAGQHVNVGVEVNGRRVTRSYSLSNAPRRDGRLEITIKHVPGGVVSTHLCQHLKVGDVLEIGPAFGELTLPAKPEGAWLFLAAGSGITPLMSLIRQLANQNMPVNLTLAYWARTRADVCFARELQELAQRYPRFKLHLILTREPHRLADELSGRISSELLTQMVDNLGEQQIYACGPGGFVESARAVTGAAQLFKAEAFTPATPIDLHQGNETVQLKLNRSGKTLTVPAGLSLLSALEAQGVHPRHGCRMGICHTCVCTKLEGTVEDTYTGDRDAEPDTTVRICVSRPCTDISLDL